MCYIITSDTVVDLSHETETDVGFINDTEHVKGSWCTGFVMILSTCPLQLI